MASTTRPAIDCADITGRRSRFGQGRHHLGPSPAYAACTDTDLSETVDIMLRMATACDNGVPMSDRRIWLAEADARLTELAERALWPPHVAALDDAIETHIERADR